MKKEDFLLNLQRQDNFDAMMEMCDFRSVLLQLIFSFTDYEHLEAFPDQFNQSCKMNQEQNFSWIHFMGFGCLKK